MEIKGSHWPIPLRLFPFRFFCSLRGFNIKAGNASSSTPLNQSGIFRNGNFCTNAEPNNSPITSYLLMFGVFSNETKPDSAAKETEEMLMLMCSGKPSKLETKKHQQKIIKPSVHSIWFYYTGNSFSATENLHIVT